MKKSVFFLCMMLMYSVMPSCSFLGGETDEPKMPSVVTNYVTEINIEQGTAKFNGQITFVGNPIYSEKGFVYATHENPTMNDTWKNVPGNRDAGEFSALVQGLQKKTTYYIRAYARNSTGIIYGNEISLDFSAPGPDLQSLKASGSIGGHDYVDLGLSVKWATYNVGANTITESGDYFAWGETTPYDKNLTWTNYFWPHNPCSPDNILSSIYDAATVNWGNSWRMPTFEEQKELLEKCKWTWIDNIYNSSTSGYIVTSTVNQKSIFLPAVKYISHDKYDVITEKDGWYWSSWKFDTHGKYSWQPSGGAGALKFIDMTIGMVLPAEQIFATMGDGLSVRAVVGTPNDYLPNRDTVTINQTETNRQGFPVSGFVDGYSYVDLGLPSHTLWATYNVGASLPHEDGEYYCWGETSPNELYGWDEYYKFFTKHSDKGPYYYAQYSKYTWFTAHHGTVDGKYILDPEDDAASVNWSSRWCMPTPAQIDELNAYCTTFRKDITINGKTYRGFVAQSTVNDNIAFFPYADFKNDCSGVTVGAHLDAWYWTNTLDDETDYWAKCAIFSSKENLFKPSHTGRTNGLSVRAVVKK